MEKAPGPFDHDETSRNSHFSPYQNNGVQYKYYFTRPLLIKYMGSTSNDHIRWYPLIIFIHSWSWDWVYNLKLGTKQMSQNVTYSNVFDRKPTSTPYMSNDSSNNMLFYLRIHISNQQWKSEDLTPYGCESFVYICTWSNNIDISSRDSWSTELWNKCYMLYESYRPFD